MVRDGTGMKKRKYKSYSNKDKIEFLQLAAEIGRKKAAHNKRISWSTAKTWLKKDEKIRQTEKHGYVDKLMST